MANYKIINITTGDLVLSDGTIIEQAGYKNVDVLSDAVILAYNETKVSIDPTPTNSGVKLTDSSGGTAATDGVIAAVTDVATAADAIATLAAAIEANRWD